MMTSLVRKNDRRPKFSATNLSFLKSISEKTSKDTNLRLPMNFVEKHRERYGKELSNIAHLKLPCGAEWEVEVTRHNDVFWFEKEWEEFSKFYSLQSGDLLVFQYEGDSRFTVKIFDKTKTEIDYPIKAPKMKENDVDGHFPLARTPLPQMKKTASSSGGKKDLPAEKDEGGKSSTTQRSRKPTIEVLERLKAFKAENPSYFWVTMYPSYINGNMLWLSSEISMHMTHHSKNTGNVRLRVSEGTTRGTWTVEMKYDNERATFRFQFGWSKFVQGNNLNADDVCGFMLSDEVGLLFEVKIFRTREAANYTLSPALNSIPWGGPEDNNEDDADDEDDHEHDDDNAADDKMHRSFRRVLPKYSISSSFLWLSSKFAKKHLSKKPSNATLHVSGGVGPWPVALKYEGGKEMRVKFQSGWTKFVRDNNLKVGDECLFVLTDDNRLSFEVVIVAANSALSAGPVDIADNDNGKDDENNMNDEDANDNSNDDEDDDEYLSASRLHKRRRLSSSTKSSIKDVGGSTSTGQFLKRIPDVPRSLHLTRATENDIALKGARASKNQDQKDTFELTQMIYLS